jgi:T-complex protein 1 subunit gamma
LVPGGGAIEMSVSQHLKTRAQSIEGVEQWPYRAVSMAMEVIPRTLATNCGAKTIRVITELRAKHAVDPVGNSSWGINGSTGELVDMHHLGIWEPLAVKAQTIKTAIEAACMLLRVDDIVSGMKGAGGPGGPPPGGMPPGMGGMPPGMGGMPGM